MPYKYLEETVVADVAFKVWGKNLEDIFTAAAEATLNVMVSDLDEIAPRQKVEVSLKNSQLDRLLINWLQEIIYYKDAQGWLLRPGKLVIQHNAEYTLEAQLQGEKLDPQKHDLLADVKGVTLHRFKLEQEQGMWQAQLVLDV